MWDALLQMACLIACGAAWRRLRPGGVDPDGARRALTAAVFHLFLPALVLEVLWRNPPGLDALRIAGTAAAVVLLGLAAAGLWCRLARLPGPQAGALVLAAAFPNATYLGLPVLEATFGPWARAVAIQFDLYACTPLLLSLGIALAAAWGRAGEATHPLGALLRVPPFWAALAGTLLGLAGVPLPPALAELLGLMGAAVVPLMLLALGLALRWRAGAAGRAGPLLRLLAPALALRLLLLPAAGWAVARALGLGPPLLAPTVLEAAMPSMVFGVVLADRYGLDAALYAALVTVSTTLAFLTLPLWHALLA